MEYRMRSQISGMRNGVDWPAIGEVIDLDGDEARQLLGMGVIETATAREPETAVPPAAGRSGRAGKGRRRAKSDEPAKTDAADGEAGNTGATEAEDGTGAEAAAGETTGD